ncbi:formyltetrahydrofolate deformylase [Sphingobacterium sp. SRCM116780]|uniref:formyltetrahydrofolate deformylase n=1 Tax=Sphingobacterium sp. SRCM116780 TaxID=2907623 RepID=UPI001F1655EC|nr:formyltetrahydrofolate deformylase [Sphingobacterium sp. SRCM116780]UIR55079.1 formyltetrahydrofolate deformylase [Sphingobacterium sp. SRCM116780]
MQNQTLILIQCQDAVGLVARIANTVAAYHLNIVTMREFVDEEANKFFVRVACNGELNDSDLLIASLKDVLPKDAEVSVNPSQRKKIVVLVTKEHHCLADILVRHHFESWGAEVQAVVGNYDELRNFTEKFEIPYHHIDHEGKTKEAFEQETIDQINRYDYDYIILAKFMRILSPTFVQTFEHKLINIHHSFLPAFIGANPYRQAHTRGVKIIGATAHFVTNDLDEGPIIVQNTARVAHNFTVKDMVSAGKEIEKAVLSKAIKLLSEDRVMLNGNKTVIFDS